MRVGCEGVGYTDVVDFAATPALRLLCKRCDDGAVLGVVVVNHYDAPARGVYGDLRGQGRRRLGDSPALTQE